MAQRNSEYPRLAGDAYWTPAWVYDELLKVEPFDFLAVDSAPSKVLATNPPFSMIDPIIRHALELIKPDGRLAILAPMTFDCAKGRVDLWKPPFKVKLTLLRRIRWENLPQKAAGPSSIGGRGAACS